MIWWPTLEKKANNCKPKRVQKIIVICISVSLSTTYTEAMNVLFDPLATYIIRMQSAACAAKRLQKMSEFKFRLPDRTDYCIIFTALQEIYEVVIIPDRNK